MSGIVTIPVRILKEFILTPYHRICKKDNSIITLKVNFLMALVAYYLISCQLIKFYDKLIQNFQTKISNFMICIKLAYRYIISNSIKSLKNGSSKVCEDQHESRSDNPKINTRNCPISCLQAAFCVKKIMAILKPSLG